MEWGWKHPYLKYEKYKILQDTMAGGSKVHAGDIVELNEVEGHSLCGYQKAEVHVSKPKPKKEDRSVGLKTSKVKAPKTRAKNKSCH